MFMYAFSFDLEVNYYCTHTSYWDFRLFWTTQADADYTTGVDTDLFVSLTPYTGTANDATGCTTPGTTMSFCLETATGCEYTAERVKTSYDVNGADSTYCGFDIVVTAGSNSMTIEFDTNNSMMSTLGAFAVAVFATTLF